MSKTEYKPKHLYIYTEFPNPAVVDPRMICTSYKATSDAIIRGDQEVHTLQLVFFNHLFIKAGYVLHLRDGKYEYIFDQEWLDETIPPDCMVNQYWLLDQFRWGMITGYDEDDEM